MRRVLRLLFITGCIGLVVGTRFAEAITVRLTNGDQITAHSVSEIEGKLYIRTELLGLIAIEKGLVQEVVEEAPANVTPEAVPIVEEADPESLKEEVAQAVKAEPEPPTEAEIQAEQAAPAPSEAPKPKLWKNNISTGYTSTRGNTQNSRASIRLTANRKTDVNELTLRADTYYSSSYDKVDARKHYALGRYAFSFGDELKWYSFQKVEADHDRFSNIDYRLIPASGVGYWFSDTDEWKAMSELAVGLEYTNFVNEGVKDSNVGILVPRAYVRKKIIKTLSVSQDMVMYPEFQNWSDFRAHSESELSHKISDRLSWRFSWINDFNSSPQGAPKKHDSRMITAIDYAF